MDALAALHNTDQVTALVIGDVMLDSYLVGHVNRISPEAPVPVVDVKMREQRLGGAANVVKNLVALGAKVHLSAVIGEDAAGNEIKTLLQKMNVQTNGLITCTDRPTPVKTRIISNGQQLLRVDEEQTHGIEESQSLELINHCERILKEERIDVVIFEDYDKGTLTTEVIERIIQCCSKLNILTAVDPKFRNFRSYQGVTLFKPNFKELTEGLGIAIHKSSDESLYQSIQKLHSLLKPQISMVTLSERGVSVSAPDRGLEFKRIPAFEREITDVSGAGDAVIAVASVLLALEVPIEELAAVSNLAGGLVCERVGVVPVDRLELLNEWELYLSKINTPLT